MGYDQIIAVSRGQIVELSRIRRKLVRRSERAWFADRIASLSAHVRRLERANSRGISVERLGVAS